MGRERWKGRSEVSGKVTDIEGGEMNGEGEGMSGGRVLVPHYQWLGAHTTCIHKTCLEKMGWSSSDERSDKLDNSF